jgi:hypothetical protein
MSSISFLLYATVLMITEFPAPYFVKWQGTVLQRKAACGMERGLGFVVSCGGSDQKEWRTELELGSRNV